MFLKITCFTPYIFWNFFIFFFHLYFSNLLLFSIFGTFFVLFILKFNFNFFTNFITIIFFQTLPSSVSTLSPVESWVSIIPTCSSHPPTPTLSIVISTVKHSRQLQHNYCFFFKLFFNHNFYFKTLFLFLNYIFFFFFYDFKLYFHFFFQT